MQREDLPISSMALKTAINSDPLTISPDTLLLDAIALMSRERRYCLLPNRQMVNGDWGLGSGCGVSRSSWASMNLFSDFRMTNETCASCVLVMEEGQLVGLLTERDFVRFAAAGMNLQGIIAADVMTRQLITLNQADLRDIFTVLNLFRQHQIRHLPILNDDGQLVGMVTPDSLRQVLQPANLLQWRCVAEVMTPDIIQATPTTSLGDVARLMAEYRVSCVVITQTRGLGDEEDKENGENPSTSSSILMPLGIITERDIVQFQALELDFITLPAQSVMSSPLFCLGLEESLWKAHQEMHQRQVQQLVVCGPQGELVGIITQTSILRTFHPTELYSVIQGLQQQVSKQQQIITSLEIEKVELLEHRQTELEQELQERTEQLQQAVEALKQLNEELELRVQDRTAQLTALNQQLRQEIQERERMETALQREFDLLARVMETSPIGIAMVNPQGQIILANDQAERVLGLKQKQKGQRLGKCRTRGTIGAQDLPFWQVVSTRQAVYDLCHTLEQPDGRRVLLSINGAPLFDDEGQLKGVVFAIEDITERVRTEQELRETKDQLEIILQGVTDGINVLDPSGQLVYVNDAAAKTAGYPSAQGMLKDAHANLLLDKLEIRDELGQPFPVERLPGHLALQGIQHSNATVRFRIKATGEERWSTITATPIFDQQGRVRLAVILTHDITELKQAETALRQSEERFRTVADFTYDWEYWCDPDGNFIYVSPSCERVTGYGANDFLNDSSLLETIVHPDDRALFAAHNCENVVSDRVSTLDFRIITRSGDVRWIAQICQVMYSPDGAWHGLRASNRDITERKQAEEALRQSEERFRATFEQAAVGIAHEGLDGRFLRLNQRFCDIVGFSHDELLQKTFADITYPADTTLDKSYVEELLAGKISTFSLEKRYIRKNGSAIWVSLTVSLARQSSGDADYFIKVIQDITDRKQAEASLQQLNQQLAGWVGELRIRNREMALLGEMSDFLQACQTVEEAYSAIASLVEPLFPDTSGGVFVINSSNHWVEAVATWGTDLTSKILFTTHECWALRRGRLHWVTPMQSGLLCPHVHQPLPPESLCVPMMAQGKALGILYLSSLKAGRLTEAKQRLAVTVAEHLGLSLANLKLHETLAQQSIRDPLTGLFNRRYMEESLERELHCAQRRQRPMGIIMLDIDHFKHFNDTFGHEAGDAVLRKLGLFLQRSIRGSDIACRYGGEELMLILPEASLTDTTQRAEQIRQGIKDLKVENRRQLLKAITVSVGVAGFPDHGLTAEALIDAADVALYRAKSQGRDRIVTADVL